MEGEKLPISEKIRVIRYMNIFRSDRWWAACALIKSFGRRQVALYLWHNRGGFWKRRQKFVFRSRQEWESVKAIVDELVRRRGWAKRLLFGRGSPLSLPSTRGS